jgi:hypothetical protein
MLLHFARQWTKPYMKINSLREFEQSGEAWKRIYPSYWKIHISRRLELFNSRPASGFHRIRHYGLLASKRKLAQARQCLEVAPPDIEPTTDEPCDDTPVFHCLNAANPWGLSPTFRRIIYPEHHQTWKVKITRAKYRQDINIIVKIRWQANYCWKLKYRELTVKKAIKRGWNRQ